MSEVIGGIFAMAVILFLGLCLVYAPKLLIQTYHLKRDCEVIHQKKCVWQMLPAPPSQN
jgi:hypothetical protein